MLIMNNLPRRRLTETVALLDRFHRLHRIDPFDGVGRQPLPSRAFDFSSPGPLLPTGPGRPGPHPTGPPTGLLESPLTSGPGPVPPAASSGRAATRRTAPQTADARPANLKPAPRPRPARLTRVSTGLGAGGLGAGQTADALPTAPGRPPRPARASRLTHTPAQSPWVSSVWVRRSGPGNRAHKHTRAPASSPWRRCAPGRSRRRSGARPGRPHATPGRPEPGRADRRSRRGGGGGRRKDPRRPAAGPARARCPANAAPPGEHGRRGSDARIGF